MPLAIDQFRTVRSEPELRTWLENMVWYHRFSLTEISGVTGLDEDAIKLKLDEFNISSATCPARDASQLLVLPYPGGRHPRIGFLDGAIAPQRETKLSAFCPWDDDSYAVIDVPEAIWSNLGLTYLAHTHIDTFWSKQNIRLPQLEWLKDGDSYVSTRTLPNQIEFGVKVSPARDHLRMKMWLTNGTNETLSDLRVQNCVMLGAVRGFDQQSNDNKVFRDGYAIAHSPGRDRWVISGWDPVHRTWGNAGCPCLHSDPKFPDCAPGETQWLRGWFSFYEGTDIESELARIEQTGWRTHALHHVTGNLIGKVMDSDTGRILPSRLYVQNVDTQEFYFASSTAVAGSAVVYDKQLGKTPSIERHSTLSADGFQLIVPAGKYRVSAMHGKEYRPAEAIVEVEDSRVSVELSMHRMAEMSKLGWYSGDTHVHRTMEELPNVLLAEDLHVALPLNYWVRDSREIPSDSGPWRVAEPIYVDSTHVIYPVNTEYEIFTVDGKRHTQGAVFILNHQTPLELPAPPVEKIAIAARKQGAILDLDKHSWNWSMMVVPIMNVDLFELSNNHHWRTQFGFPAWTLENAPPNWPEIETDEVGFTERGWTEFGFQTYYALLNCGFRMRVTAGTASGVHPVPLGHSRVYVHVGQDFTYENWIENLNAGHSFVTQGPLLDVRFNGLLPGSSLPAQVAEPVADTASQSTEVVINGNVYSDHRLLKLEIVRNGEVIQSFVPRVTSDGVYGHRYTIDLKAQIHGSGWLALRCFEEPDTDSPTGKVIFAHTNPVFVDRSGAPLRPRRRDAAYFVQRMEGEIQRNADLLSDEALVEFRAAKEIYEKILATARD